MCWLIDRDGHSYSFNERNLLWKNVSLRKNKQCTNKRNHAEKKLIIFFKNQRFKIVWIDKTIFFIERSFSEKTKKIDGKLIIVLRTHDINFFNDWKKTEEMGRSHKRKEQYGKKLNVPIATVVDAIIVMCCKGCGSVFN